MLLFCGEEVEGCEFFVDCASDEVADVFAAGVGYAFEEAVEFRCESYADLFAESSHCGSVLSIYANGVLE